MAYYTSENKQSSPTDNRDRDKFSSSWNVTKMKQYEDSHNNKKQTDTDLDADVDMDSGSGSTMDTQKEYVALDNQSIVPQIHVSYFITHQAMLFLNPQCDRILEDKINHASTTKQLETTEQILNSYNCVNSDLNRLTGFVLSNHKNAHIQDLLAHIKQHDSLSHTPSQDDEPCVYSGSTTSKRVVFYFQKSGKRFVVNQQHVRTLTLWYEITHFIPTIMSHIKKYFNTSQTKMMYNNLSFDKQFDKFLSTELLRHHTNRYFELYSYIYETFCT